MDDVTFRSLMVSAAEIGDLPTSGFTVPADVSVRAWWDDDPHAVDALESGVSRFVVSDGTRILGAVRTQAVRAVLAGDVGDALRGTLDFVDVELPGPSTADDGDGVLLRCRTCRTTNRRPDGFPPYGMCRNETNGVHPLVPVLG